MEQVLKIVREAVFLAAYVVASLILLLPYN